MRYIRVKNPYCNYNEEIIDTSLTSLERDEDGGYSADKYTFYPNEIISESDNLLDLLDGFIVTNDRDQNLWIFLEVKEYLYDKENDILLDTWDYKGFIKTDKGLIYVAQQNRNTGELELL